MVKSGLLYFTYVFIGGHPYKLIAYLQPVKIFWTIKSSFYAGYKDQKLTFFMKTALWSCSLQIYLYSVIKKIYTSILHSLSDLDISLHLLCPILREAFDMLSIEEPLHKSVIVMA